MNKTKLILIISIIALICTPTVSASFLNDLNGVLQSGARSITHSAKTLSLPGTDTVTIKCGSGATCSQPGENWLVTMNSMSSAQTISLELPAGTKSINGDIEVTTGAWVAIDVTEKAPIQTVPIILNSNYKYWIRNFLLNEYNVKVYERSSISSIITTNYDIQLLAPEGNSQVVSKSYDYRYPQQVNLYDGAGNKASITPSHQISGGITTDIASVIFVDNGYGKWEAFDKTNFKTYLDKVNTENQWSAPYGGTQSWPDFLARMKTLGLNQFTDIPLSKNGDTIIMTYPVGSVGTSLQAIIPKAMALSVTVIQNNGDPVIDSAVLSPSQIVKGQGLAALTVKVTNRGSTDTINAAAIVNGGTITNIVNSLRLAQNTQGTFSFSINPTVSVASDLSIKIIVTAGGSGKQVEKTVILKVTIPEEPCPLYNPLCKDKTQKMVITAYAPDGTSVLSNAPIFINDVQAGTGQKEVTKPYGTYRISTNNASNPAMHAPTPVEITLSGGEPKKVALYFKNTPQEDVLDLTWIFWAGVIILIIYVTWRTGFLQSAIANPIGIGLIILLIIILGVLYALIQAITAFSNTVSWLW